MTPGKTGIKNRRRWIPAVTVLAATAIGTGMATVPAWAAPPIPESGTLTWTITSNENKPATGAAPVAVQGPVIVEFEPDALDAPVNTVYATLEGSVPAGTSAEVDVRGLKADGSWTAWTDITEDATAVLPECTTSVQTRLVLNSSDSASPDIDKIDLTGWDSAQVG